MSSRIPAPAFLVAFALTLAGCAGLAPSSRDASTLGAAEPFELQGRVFARFSDRAFTGNIRWRHTPSADELWLGGPLGQTAAHIVRDASGATLTTANQQTYRSMNLEASMRDAMGWSLPLADLSYYVRGNTPFGVADANVKRDVDRRLLSVSHNGWEVELTPAEQPEPSARPKGLRMRKDAIEVRIVIDQLDGDIS